MGRKKLYLSEDEIRDAYNRRAREYYQKNKDLVKAKNLAKYHENKSKLNK
jgi:hypothetical protein